MDNNKIVLVTIHIVNSVHGSPYSGTDGKLYPKRVC